LGLDILQSENVDIVCDIEKNGIPLDKETVEEIFSFHFLEHVNDVMAVMREFHRVLEIGGKAEIVVPHFSNIGAYHFLHKTYWNVRGFDMFEKGHPHNRYCSDINMKIEVRNIEFSEKRKYKPTLFEKIFRNHRGTLYEKYFSGIIRAYQIRIIMRKIE
ncbi:MAG: methyltransferase domain-containing protein, partial [Candidatus Thermoplasmatota archaeon]|nr:methyltransferase domain-containing protein [Candidatus Thermoplasmatota archaeon]